MYMSSDARRIHRVLKGMFTDRPEPDMDEVIDLEQAILAYYPNPIINIIEDMIKKAKPEKLDNYANFSYHVPGLRRITSRRSKNPPQIKGDTAFYTTMQFFQSTLLVSDYNYEGLLLMIEISNDTNITMSMLANAARVAKEAGARTIQYVHAVIRRELSEKQAHAKRIEEITSKAESATTITNDGLSAMERFSVMAMWQQRVEDSKFEQMARRVTNAKKV